MLCIKYNDAIERVRDYRQVQPADPMLSLVSHQASNSLLKHIMQQAYNQAVVDPDKLNQYEPFSPEVYGETSFEFVAQMVQRVGDSGDDIFIDLGSGVGQVVLQMAASTSAKLCVGIEKAEVPANYAQAMSDAFKFWMSWFGKRHSEYRLFKGDFFADKFRDTINNSSFIFVNNFAFGPNVDHMLKLRFADLKDGARIVSSKAFCPLNFRITDRTLSGTYTHSMTCSNSLGFLDSIERATSFANKCHLIFYGIFYTKKKVLLYKKFMDAFFAAHSQFCPYPPPQIFVK